jgi:L-threonylcarbamoyladenylate synthase
LVLLKLKPGWTIFVIDMAEIGTDIEQAKRFLEEGQLVAIPTETVYGLAANALDVEAVLKIFKTKNRPEFDPLIVHISGYNRLNELVLNIPEPLRQLAEQFWPGPLTLLLPKKSCIPDLVTSGLSTVGIRVPAHPVTQKLLESLNFPLAAPSANPFGYISPTQASHVNDQLGGLIPYILDGGPCGVGLESTIVGMEDGSVVVYRIGGLALSEISRVVGNIKVRDHSTSNPKAPGMLKSHYAPGKPFIVGNLSDMVHSGKYTNFGILSFCQEFPEVKQEFVQVLSKAGDPNEAARNLFTAMRTLDTVDVSVILAELLPEEGLGRAINDRLRRAAAEG